MKYKEYSEEAYQSILSYVMKSVEIDENDPYIKRLYIAAARVPKFSIEYSCEDISHIMLKIEKAVWAWEKENTEGDFFVDGGGELVDGKEPSGNLYLHYQPSLYGYMRYQGYQGTGKGRYR